MEKSDVSLFTQILLATQTIAYLSNRITEVNDQMKNALDSLNQEEHKIQIKVISKSVKNKDVFLSRVLKRLNKLIEDLANDMNESDIVGDADEKITEAVFPLVGMAADF